MSEGRRDGGERGADREGGPGEGARVGMLEPGGNEPALQEIFDRVLEERGNVPHMFRTAGRLPGHFVTMYRHFATVMSEGEVPRRLKELVAVRVSALNGCRY